jgi:hypothetical protein
MVILNHHNDDGWISLIQNFLDLFYAAINENHTLWELIDRLNLLTDASIVNRFLRCCLVITKDSPYCPLKNV